MLKDLRIENFAIIDQLELSFGDGLIIFTGETGAGKSIILDALDLLLGGKADPNMVRSGSERAIVEGEFFLDIGTKEDIITLLKSEDLFEEQDYVTIGREIRKEGRSITRINGRSVNSSFLKEIASLLIDIHGQSEHLSIFDPRTHIELLDRFANLSEHRSQFLSVYNEYNKIKRELNAVREIQANSLHRMDMLNYQVDEIRKANLKLGEDIDLKLERDRLANAESLATLSQQATQLLDESGFDNPSITDQVGNLTSTLHQIARLDPTQIDLTERADSVLETLTEIAHDLRNYSEQIEFNPKRLEVLEDRLDLFNQLFRKYGGSIEAVIDFGAKAEAELDTINNGDEKVQELTTQLGLSFERLQQIGNVLTERRISAAGILSKNVEAELDDLKMTSALMKIDIQTNSSGIDGQMSFDKTGFDRVEFMIAPNQGEGFKPLVKIASGGETSRLMLALKNTLAREDHIPTLVFDEIDQGIGGRVGNVVGNKLNSLSTSHQVLCITHLPQLAAFGKQHFKVEKQLANDRTTTHVKQLDDEERIIELALMFGELTEGTLTSAREILSLAQSQKIPDKYVDNEKY